MANSVSPANREAVAERARFRCEYCLIHEDHVGYPHQVDHILSRKHGGDSSPENLAYACVFCNRYKGSDVATIDPDSGLAILLFHPRTDRWDLHFRLVDCRIEGYTPSALATIRILRLNDPERVAERNLISSLPR